MPKSGETFCGFQLVRELGRGSFGRVYLATQPELSGRTVALKVSADLTGESRALAQLQHTNIVPVYSVHQDGLLHAVCMPFFGATTLNDLIRRGRAQSTLPTSGQELVTTLRSIVDNATTKSLGGSHSGEIAATSITPAPTADKKTDAVFGQLSQLSYTKAVCWIIARVADGLAHAHERGILHRDVKPANILITDDGQPMLLDFGVAEDLNLRATVGAERVGGTVPYMAPEHLDEIRNDEKLLDHRSDLYSLGIILYELLAGQHPFRTPNGDLKSELEGLIRDRKSWVPDLQALNPDVPADLQSIVRKSVATDPAARFQSAAHLRDDLERHLRDEPLQIAAEPSAWNSFRKWRKRHPRFASQFMMVCGLVSAIVLSICSIAAWKRMEAIQASEILSGQLRDHELIRLQAENQFQDFQTNYRQARYLSLGREKVSKTTLESIDLLHQLLADYRVLDLPNWDQADAVTALPEAHQAELRRTLSDICLFLARGYLKLESNADRLAKANESNKLAESIRGTAAPRAVYTQRAEIQTLLQDKNRAKEIALFAETVPLQTADDFCLSANELTGVGRYADAIPLLRKATRMEPSHFWSQFGLAVAYQESGRWPEARAHYEVTIALRPEFTGHYFNRAMTALTHREYEDVVSDLNAVLARKPGYLPALLHRGQALGELKHYEAALADLDAVLDAKDTGGFHLRAYLKRAKIKEALGDENGADDDTEAGFRIRPTDESSWLVRAHARMDYDPKAALSDLEEAVKIAPNSLQIRQNQAYLLDKLGRNLECRDVMSKLVELAPTSSQYRTGLAVLHARLGECDEAIRRIRLEQQQDKPISVVWYHAGCVFALASRKQPQHKAEAIRNLKLAIQEGFTAEVLRTDPDLECLRTDVEFQKLLPKK
jgi:eukaryotic-like serine/threonine-protein kinase